jgi:hypothetical protein
MALDMIRDGYVCVSVSASTGVCDQSDGRKLGRRKDSIREELR